MESEVYSNEVRFPVRDSALSGSLRAPGGLPARVVHRFDARLFQNFEARSISILFPIEDVGHVGLHHQLGAHDARARSDERHLPAHLPGRFHERIHLRVDTAALPRLGRVATIREAAGVSVVPDRDHVLKMCVRDDRADLQSRTRRALREFFGHPHIDFEKGRTIRLCQADAIRLTTGIFDHIQRMTILRDSVFVNQSSLPGESGGSDSTSAPAKSLSENFRLKILDRCPPVGQRGPRRRYR